MGLITPTVTDSKCCRGRAGPVPRESCHVSHPFGNLSFHANAETRWILRVMWK